MSGTIVWYRQDLRLADNPAWSRAVYTGEPVYPVYIFAPHEEDGWESAAAARCWLHEALKDLSSELLKHRSRLLIYRGDTLDVINRLLRRTGATRVYWNRRYEPASVKRDGKTRAQLEKDGIDVWNGNAGLLFEPWEVSTQAGSPYKVFTPFSKACHGLKLSAPEVLDSKIQVNAPSHWPPDDGLEGLKLLPNVSWHQKFNNAWEMTREGGIQRLEEFLNQAIFDYTKNRDYPLLDGTSRLSPYLHWGQVGPREIVARMRSKRENSGSEVFLNELLWREFAHHVLYHFPKTVQFPLQDKFREFPWQENPTLLRAWQQGCTGYPIVDAGMRQLWATGWMHNRLRMIVASFLVKHLLQSWQAGARWFWDTLVDANLANNTLGWQWAGGCGADAAPYFRIFNPMTQGKKFDKEGEFVRRYIPEIASLPNKYIHEPWEAPESVLRQCGISLGKEYPQPIVNHQEARHRALAAFEKVKKSS